MHSLHICSSSGPGSRCGERSVTCLGRMLRTGSREVSRVVFSSLPPVSSGGRVKQKSLKLPTQPFCLPKPEPATSQEPGWAKECLKRESPPGPSHPECPHLTTPHSQGRGWESWTSSMTVILKMRSPDTQHHRHLGSC